MRGYSAYFGVALGLLVGLTIMVGVPSGPAWAQEEVTSTIYRYRERVATGYYEGYEVSPRRARATVEVPGTNRALFPLGHSAAMVRIRARLPDSHRGLQFYYRKTCIECHPYEARDLHTTRAGISCRQCHGPEPIAAVNHYYSPMNPLRRHGYVCAKCHEGANAAFAGFYVHEPPAASLETMKSFPILFFVYWGMLLLLAGTLAFFIPHSLMVGFREIPEALDSIVPQSGMEGLRRRLQKAALFPRDLFVALKGLLQEKAPRVALNPSVSSIWGKAVAGPIRFAARLFSLPIVMCRKILARLKRGSRPGPDLPKPDQQGAEKEADHVD